MKLTFLGATKTVTGSKYLLDTGARQILVDCGLFQGFKELRLRNRARLPIRPADVEVVLLTHAHLDHSGYLPLLVQNGFKGPVYCTRGTADLCAILLPDSGHLQEEEAERANRKGYSKHKPALPLYTREDAVAALDRLRTVPYDKAFDLGDGITARFDNAGHILGASLITITAKDRTIVFSGDLGRPHDVMLYPPTRIRQADYLLIESTYGNRNHLDVDPMGEFAAIVRRTVARGGTVVIPSNAVGRAQMVMFYIHRMKQAATIPDVPVWLDSPMSANVTDLYRRHTGLHRLSAAQCADVFGSVRIANSVDQSKSIDRDAAPKIVISASGMATGGRVLHHIKRFAPDQRNTLLFVGFQAGGTRGRKLQEGADTVRMFGTDIEINAEIATLDGLSAHADYEEILEWLDGFEAPPRTTFIVHGEPDAAEAMQQRIRERLHWHAVVPDYRQTVTLD